MQLWEMVIGSFARDSGGCFFVCLFVFTPVTKVWNWSALLLLLEVSNAQFSPVKY